MSLIVDLQCLKIYRSDQVNDFRSLYSEFDSHYKRRFSDLYTIGI